MVDTLGRQTAQGGGIDGGAPAGGRPSGPIFAGGQSDDATLAERLTSEIGRSPLGAFVALVLAALAVYVTVVIVVPASPSAFNLWSAGVGRFAAAAAGLAALLCCHALDQAADGPEASAEGSIRRLVAALALTAAVLALLCVQRVLLAHYLGDPTVTLGGAIRAVLTDPTKWATAVAVGLVLAAVATPAGTARRIARSLVAVRRRRVQVLSGVALIAPIALALLAVVFVRALPTASPSAFVSGTPLVGIGEPLGSSALGNPLPYAIVSLACVLVVALPLVFAWYGYAAERLERRLSPLYVGVVIGAATALPSLALTEVVSGHYGISASGGIGVGLALIGDVALAVLAVRLRQLSRGSLLPSAVLLATASVAFSIFAWWPQATADRSVTGEKAYAWALVGAAVVVLFQASMWRRSAPEPAGTPGPDGAAGPARRPAPPPPAYEVVVKDLGMPSETLQAPDATKPS
jgi:hypothetical protein